MNPDVLARWQEMEGCHAEARRLIDVEYRWMLACLWVTVLIVPLPFTLIGWLRARRRLRAAQVRAQTIAERVQQGNFAPLPGAPL